MGTLAKHRMSQLQVHQVFDCQVDWQQKSIKIVPGVEAEKTSLATVNKPPVKWLDTQIAANYGNMRFD